MTDRIPRVSVVIASIVGEAFLDDCLTSLEPQARSMDAEVIVVACGPAERAERLPAAVSLDPDYPSSRPRNRSTVAPARRAPCHRKDCGDH